MSNLSAESRKLYHLGAGDVARSSLTRVNGEQPQGLYEELFGRLLARCRTAAPGHGFRFRGRLFSLDATTIRVSTCRCSRGRSSAARRGR